MSTLAVDGIEHICVDNLRFSGMIKESQLYPTTVKEVVDNGVKYLDENYPTWRDIAKENLDRLDMSSTDGDCLLSIVIGTKNWRETVEKTGLPDGRGEMYEMDEYIVLGFNLGRFYGYTQLQAEWEDRL